MRLSHYLPPGVVFTKGLPIRYLFSLQNKEQLYIKLSTSLGFCFEIIHIRLRFFCCVENYVIDCYLISLIWSHSILFLLSCQKDDAPIIHLLGGPNLHSLSAITQLNNNKVIFLFWCSELWLYHFNFCLLVENSLSSNLLCDRMPGCFLHLRSAFTIYRSVNFSIC